ncbi:hypothetical protein H8D36_02405 [archaeon]|nr:hypothetical protein [archaeon]MBL7057221.1 hypothetical protein [Candidatus Woesearchaeota archaeon]
MKKAQISIQLNWIFVFIVGAVILLFFVMIVQSQTKDANFELAGALINNLDTVIKSSEQSSGSLKLIQMPDITIEFVCEPDISFYDIGNGVKKDTPYDIIFSQSKLRGHELISWTRSWDLPFRIGFFQYLTTKRTLFIVVKDLGGSAEELYDELPSNITKMLVDQDAELEELNYDSYKIIEFVGNEHDGINVHMRANKVHKITINTTDIDSYGEITFDDDKTHKFLKKESLFGAIFSEDAAFYECTMNKSFQRLNTLMTLNQNRIENLSSSVTDISCRTFYSWALDEIQTITNNPTLANTVAIYQNSANLEQDNDNLMRAKKCPLIY